MDNDVARTDRPSQLTGPLNDRYLYLREDKAPVSWDMYALDDAASCKTVGVLIPNQYVVVDVDNMEQAEKLMRLVTEENIKCQIMQTTRGKHFWFTLSKPIKNSIAVITGIGIYADYRSWGKQSEVCIRMNGEWRKWLTEYKWSELDALPRWLRPLLQSKWKFYEMGEGDGRNQALFDYQIMLSKRGYPKQEAFDVLRLINTYIFEEAMPDNEINTICRDEAYPELSNSASDGIDLDAPWIGAKGKFMHNVMGDMLIKEMNIVCYHQQLYTYRDGCYRPSENEVTYRITEDLPSSTKKQREEVMDYIRIQTHIEHPDENEFIINFKNGRLDLKTLEILPHTPEAIDFQQINATYDPTVFYEPLDNMLRKVFCGDPQLYKLFEEIMGYCLLKNCRMQKIIIFFGDGSNGKSTILRLIRHFVGTGNYSTLSMQDIESQFRPAELENKLVNIGDDIPATQIKDSSRLKSLSHGEEITVERKNKNPFNLENYAKLIFSTNKIPPVADKSHGFYRTLTLVPFDARFSPSDSDYDPDIEEKMTSPEAMSYLLNIAIRGFKRMMKHGFTKSDKVENALENYKIESSNSLRWAYDTDATCENLTSKHTGELYYDFKNWCAENGIEPPKHQTFSTDIKKHFGFEMSPQQREPKTGKRIRFFMKPSVTTS